MSTRLDDEEAPLLSNGPSQPGAELALSWFQIAVVLLLQLADHIVGQVLNPFIPALVGSLEITRGEESKVSVYVGILQSLYFVSTTLTTLFWSRASDRLGRKPILLCGMFASVVSMLGIGLTRGYWWLVISRCINGAFNGNVGVIKSLMGEVTTNSDKLAQLYSLLPIAWATTGTVGPLIGGYLSSPTDRFPDTFGSSIFLAKYPYFLPCAVTAAYIMFAWLVTLVFLRETLKYRVSFSTWLGFGRISGGPRLQPGSHTEPPPLAHTSHSTTAAESERPLPMMELLRNSRVLLAALNYACLCLTQSSLNNFQPVQFATSVENGGMGFDPPLIGRILSTYGFMNGVLQLLLFARIHKYLGSKRFFVCGVSCAIPMIVSFPLANYFIGTYGHGIGVWIVIYVQVLAKIGVSMSYGELFVRTPPFRPGILTNCLIGALFILIVAAAPNHASLGATNGLCLTTGSLMRAVGPTMTNTLFSLSMKTGILGGNLVYVFLLVLVGVCLTTASALPEELWKKKE